MKSFTAHDRNTGTLAEITVQIKQDDSNEILSNRLQTSGLFVF
jgi:hypothetical protein